MRIAAAPISWGVCEVPGWGRVLDPATVLAEMAGLGVTATELGPPGYLPTDPADLTALLRRHALGLAAGFLAVPLHHDRYEVLNAVQGTAELLADGGAEVLVLAAATGFHGYDERPVLTPEEWDTLIANTALVREWVAKEGLRTVLHPHVGTHVETTAEVERFLADSDLPLCIDTGHLLIGGTDPAELVRAHPHRVGHVHLKDVRADLADAVRTGRVGYTDAVAQGVYVPLGDGDIDLVTLLTLLRDNGYDGWYVLEQDTALASFDTSADRVPREATARSLAFLDSVH
jgi:inosose dehydratase